MGDAKRRKAAGLGPRQSFRVRSAAVHEAAHAVIDMHFGVRILEISVTRKGSDAEGFTDARWTELTANAFTYHNQQISQLAGPLADYMFRQSEGADGKELLALLTSCRGDFADILGRDGVTLEQAVNFGRACFAMNDGLESTITFTDEKSAVFLRNLVRDTNEIIAAYGRQIAELDNAILTAPDMKLTEAAVSEWRKHHFQPLDVGESQPKRPIGKRKIEPID
jgi:hypothetical protein